MSAYSIGAEAASLAADKPAIAASPTSAAPAAFVKWIPGEAITFYAAILGLGAAQGPLTGHETSQQVLERIDPSSAGWFLLGAGLAAVLVLMGSLAGFASGNKKLWKSVGVRIALTLVSFVIWTTALPGSWAYGWHAVRDMGAAYALLLVPVAAIFTTVAELATKKFAL